MEPINNELLKEIKQLRIDVNIIKDKLDNEDYQLTEEEEKLLDESYNDEENNNTLSSDELKKELGI